MSSEVKVRETQIIAELYDVENYQVLDDPELMKETLRKLADTVGEKEVHVHVHEFEPYGVSGFLMLKDGYVAIHTWPEHRYATMNVVGFKESWAWQVYKKAVVLFKPGKQNAIEVKSGLETT